MDIPSNKNGESLYKVNLIEDLNNKYLNESGDVMKSDLIVNKSCFINGILRAKIKNVKDFIIQNSLNMNGARFKNTGYSRYFSDALTIDIFKTYYYVNLFGIKKNLK